MIRRRIDRHSPELTGVQTVRDSLDLAARRQLSRATFEAGVQAVVHSKSDLSADERALVLSVLTSNYIIGQVSSQVSHGLSPVIRHVESTS